MSYNGISRERSKLDQQAVYYLMSTLFAEDPDSCPSYISLLISESNRENCPQLYEEDIKVFKHLFHSDDTNHRIALWNYLAFNFAEKTKFYRKDFTSEEFAFIKAAVRTRECPIYEANINKPIVTDRLVLRAIEKSDFPRFIYYYKNDGDFLAFTGYTPTNRTIKSYAKRRAPTFFAIEDKFTHSFIGYVGLTICERSQTGLIEYYIFKEHRHKGYCKEAISALVDKALKNKLVAPVETIKVGVYSKKAIKINAIRARIVATNTPSIKTVQSCGFIHEATFKNTYPSSNGWVDEVIYYLPKDSEKL